MTSEHLHNLITDLLRHAGFTVSSIENTIDESDGSYWFSISLEQPKLLIGKNGEHLQAFNMLVRKIIEAKAPESPVRVVVDINNYQRERVQNVKAIAHMMAERARYFKSSVEVDPMSSYERRIVHDFLKDASDLKTESTGEGKSRRVVIKYIGSLS